jgi:hypothetical protein
MDHYSIYIYYSDNILIPYHRYITMNIYIYVTFQDSYDFIGGGSANASFRDGLLRVDGQWFLVAFAMGISQSWSWLSMGIYFHIMGSYEIIIIYIYQGKL